jgi:histidinol dehydrogenase
MEHYSIYGAAIGTVLAVWGIVWKMTESIKKEGNDARSVLYRRFDEHKEHVDKNFVSDKICALINKQMKEDLTEIKADVKSLLKKANGG